MAGEHGYKSKYDYVELFVEPGADGWRLKLHDRRHAEDIEHDETFATAEDAKEAALRVAEHHVNIQHNDTLLARATLSWQEF